MATTTDFLWSAPAGGAVSILGGLWVRLHNNDSAIDYYSTATTDLTTGAFTHSAPPGDYSAYSGNAATVPGTPTLRNGHYKVSMPTTASNPWADVQGYGAKGDGVTNDAGAIQAAITAAGANGTVFFPPATYSITATLVPPVAGGQTWIGWGATLYWNGAVSTPMIHNVGTSGTSFLDFHIEGMTIDTHNTTGVTGLYLESWYLGSLTDVWVKNATSTGTAAVRLESTIGTTSVNACAYNNIRGLRISSAAVGLQLSGFSSAVPVTNNYFYGLMMDDIIEIGIRFVQNCDTNTFHGTRMAARGGTGTWIGIIYNDSATPNANVNVYNQHFITLAIDNPTGLAGQDAIRFNYTAGNRIQGLWTSIGPGGTPGNLFTDTNGASNAQSYTIELMSASGAFASTKSTVYNKGYSAQRSRQTPAFVTPMTPDPTLGEIIEVGTLTGSITMNAPAASTILGTGQIMTFRFTQNGTGGWVVVWNAAYKTTWQPGSQPNAISSITFYYDGTNWQQLAMGPSLDNLGRTNTPAELIVGGFLNGASSINAGTILTAAKATPAYSASITPNAAAGNWQTITVTNGTAFTINAPSNPPVSTSTQELTIEILNSSGGAMGVVTWNAAFLLIGGAFTNPANTKKRFIRFEWNGLNWAESSRSGADY